MPRGRPKKKVEVSQDKPNVVITLTLGTQTYSGEGATFAEAFDSMSRPFKIITKGTLVVSKGNKKRVLPLQQAAVKQLFFPISRLAVIKRLSFGL